MAEPAKSTREPKASKFTQQELRAYRPVLTPFKVVLAYLALGLVLIPIGAVCISASRRVHEVSHRYDNHASCLPSGAETVEEKSAAMQIADRNGTCRLMIVIQEDMEPPIYVYYGLEGYHQNHRRYVKSRNDEQLAGEDGGDMKKCKPKLYQHAGNNSRDQESRLINPCGLTAWSFFNDTFSFERNSQPIEMSEKGIAWKSDIDYLFGDHVPENFNNEPQFRGGGQINGNVNEDEHFIVWMRNAWLPKFRKLYGVIHDPISEGDELIVTIENLYNTYLFGGKKRIILSTTTWLGGENKFIGYVYLVTGGVSLVMAFVYLILHLQFPRDLGDERFLSWKRRTW